MKLLMENFNKFLAETTEDLESVTLEDLLKFELDDKDDRKELGEKLLNMARPDWKDDEYFYIRGDDEMAALLDDALEKLSPEDKLKAEKEHEGDFHRALEDYVKNHANKVGTSRQSPEEEGEASSEEEKTTRDKILDAVKKVAGSTSASEEGTAALQDALVEIGFKKEDMYFNEDYPASLSFGNPWGELGEWVFKLEGKCQQRDFGACLTEN